MNFLTFYSKKDLLRLLRIVLKYIRCSWNDKLLLLYVFFLLAIVRLLIVLVPFRYITTYLGKHMQESPYADDNENIFINQVGWAILAVSRHTPFESKCLVQAITGKILLRRRHLKNTMYLGVAKNLENQMMAHAWLRSGNVIVTGGDISNKFTVVAKFADVESG
ncbi:hypothetical protein SPACI_011840 [Sporomusa acidovorans DSM 3132]|uniref:Microcin J25-processing protein McjB C-terminal domain-containing protein n=1 Tax=Sporomusa acidovorans (strain ATCC 49682 / DSM 3132 / Mol) TaxID=1123286 RepID=A0ABZ3IYK9_SPOA4|nr:hypothetical protein SPACI_38980 [Sporomusa acidovorans DSM 3132]SDF15696.1 Transglutaminase-like superfamily protein [Sporomusa acidovorans]